MESQNNIWGPHLWIILHSLAERIHSKNHIEQTRLWSGLLSSLRWSLPCPLCKKHYSEYYATNKIESITHIRVWLYNLHSQINSRLGKENSTIEQLDHYKNPFHFSHHYSIVSEQMNLTLKHGSNRNDINRTLRLFHEIKCFYDLF